MLKVAINGLSGRVGQELLKIINSQAERYQLSDAQKLSSELHSNARQFDLAVVSSQNAQVVIDFSSPEILSEVLDVCVKNNLPLVIGTTGFDNVQLQQIEAAALQIPIILSPNMSLSVNVLFKVCQMVAAKLTRAEVEITESHHRYKKDAPSGTAIRLGEAIAEARGQDFEQVACYNRYGNQNNTRTPEEIGFSVIRGGDIVGRHSVEFIYDGEILNLTSEITNRGSFASGALHAAEYLVKQPAGLYTMEDVLGLRDI